MSAERLLSAFVITVALLGRAAAQEQPPSGTQVSFERAIAEYDVQRFGTAFDLLARLADAGHHEAARIALLMHVHGPRLYWQRFEVDAARRAQWVATALIESNFAAAPRP